MLVKEIITEAAVRVNLAPQRNPYPTVVENGFRLLKGIVNKYNADNLLNWTQNSVIIPKSNLIHIYDNTDYLKGKYNLYFDTVNELNNYTLSEDDYKNKVWAIVKDNPTIYYTVVQINNEYIWELNNAVEPYSQRYQEMKRYEAMTHVQVRNVSKINSIYVISNNGQPYKEHYSLNFVNHTDFDKFTNTSRVFTYTQKSEGEWLIELKPLFFTGDYRLKLNYNEAIIFDDDINTEWFIPDNYIELLIVALAHKLALEFPRIDESQMTRLQNEVSVLVDNVRTPRSVERNLLRKNYWDSYGRMSQSQLLSGEWL